MPRQSTTPKLKVVPTATSRAPKGAAPIPSNIDHLAAQAELDATLFPHYLLGRQLAMEETMREILLALPLEVRGPIVERLQWNADFAMNRLTEAPGITDPKEEASACGYVATLLQQGA